MNRRDIKIYTAGPYSSQTEEGVEKNIQLAEKAAGRLWQLGYTVICPQLNTQHFDKYHVTWVEFMEGYLNIIRDCHGVFLLEGWEISRGSCQEKQFAESIGIPVFETEEELLKYDWTQSRKVRLDYLMRLVGDRVQDIADVFYCDGKSKHGDKGSWGKGIKHNVEKMRSHWKKWKAGELVDEHSGKNPMSHIASRAIIIGDLQK